MALSTYVALYQNTLSSDQSTITISNIPQNYTDLKLIVSGSTSSAGGSICFRVGNNTTDSGTNYSSVYTYTTGTNSVITSKQTSFNLMCAGGWGIGFPTGTGNSFICEVDILNYSNINIFKHSLTKNGYGGIFIERAGQTWKSTSAINTISVFNNGGGNIAAGSTITLFGIANSDSGITAKAKGGILFQDATYSYHVFIGNGTFTPLQALTTDVLIVAGGGGAGGTAYSQGGGGGAGGLLGFTSQSLTSGTAYPITIGAGGTGGSSNNIGSQGGNSTFFGLTTCVGGGGGGSNNGSPTSGGSGGGGGNLNSLTTNYGAATSGQGNIGAYLPSNYQGGGGGGSGEAGPVNQSGVSRGGDGLSTYSSWGQATKTGENILGTYYYAGGGAGSAQGAGNVAGSRGGYGGGAYSPSATSSYGVTAPAGTLNTGGGGASWATNSGAVANGGQGGSGIVIVRYTK
jgi:hypothetical protein